MPIFSLSDQGTEEVELVTQDRHTGEFCSSFQASGHYGTISAHFISIPHRFVSKYVHSSPDRCGSVG